MATIRVEEQLPGAAVDFLRHCYRYTSEEWQHADRLDLPDQGYERLFRSSCVSQLNGWRISHEREMRFGQDMSTASGVLHEVDIVASHSQVNALMELKNRQEPPDKNDIVVFFAKIMDYLSANSELLLREVCPIFMATTVFDVNGLAACLGLGIHAIAPGLRPIPLLIDNAKRIDYELKQGLETSEETHECFADYCAELNSFCLGLSENWIGSRFGYHSEDTIVLRVASSLDSQAMSYTLRRLNSECSLLLSNIREAKQ